MSSEPSSLMEPRIGADYFLNRAKTLVMEEYNGLEDTVRPISTEEIYIVWFSKTLQNWKALLSTYNEDCMYYEVTYNGNLGVAYVDTYIKIKNSARSDNPNIK